MTECGLCKDCKWWGFELGQWDGWNPWRPCERFNISGSQKIRPGALARLWTTTKRGQVMFETGSDFGCVQWEAKE